MAELAKVEALHRRLLDERRKVAEAAAETGMLPPKGLLAYLATLDGATLAIETMLDQRVRPERADRDAD